jgi:hypothetical protein
MPDNTAWTAPEPITAEKLNNTTHGSGTTATRTAITAGWRADRPFFDEDEGIWYYNSHVTPATNVTWSIIGTYIPNVASLNPLVGTHDPNQIVMHDVINGNMWRAWDNITTKNQSYPPIKKWQPMTTIDSPVEALTIGNELALDEDFGQYSSAANMLLIWKEWTTDSGIDQVATGTPSTSYIQVDKHSGTLDQETSARIDLPSSLASTWVMRVEYQIVSISQGASGNRNEGGFAVSDQIDPNGAHDCYGFNTYISTTTLEHRLMYGIADSLVATLETDFLTTPTVTTHYIQLRKTNSTTVECSIYPDNTYTTPTETETDTVTNYTDLKYIHIWKFRQTGSDNTYSFRIKNIQLKNGVSSW